MKTLLRFGILLGLLATAGAAETLQFRYERPIVPGGAGPNRIAPDAALLAGAAFPDLRDLRLYDATGKETPYLLIPPEPSEPRWKTGTLLPVAATKEASGFEVDFGAAAAVDRLRLTGIPAPFLKRFRLEGSGDRSHWTLLTAEGTLFDLPDQKLRLTEAAFETGEYRYLRVTWDDRQSGRVPLPFSASARLVEPRAAAAALRTAVEFRRLGASPGHSRFQVRLPGPHLPLAALELTVAETRLLRSARVTESVLAGSEAVQQTLGTATLRRVSQGDVTAENLNIPIRAPLGRELEIVVEDASNPPLDLKGVFLVFAPQPWIYIESAPDRPLTARYGDTRLAAPRYDLEAMRHFIGRTNPKPAAWGESQTAATAEPGAEGGLPAADGAAIDAKPFRYSRRIPEAAPGLTALVLDAEVLAHSRKDLADLRIMVESSGGMRQLPYLVERRQDTFAIELPLTPEPAGPSPKQSHYRLVLPFDNLPAAKLKLNTAERVFQRAISIEAIEQKAERPSTPTTYRARMTSASVTLAAAPWRHDDPETPAPPLTLDLRASLGSSTIALIVDEGDNRPLPLSTARLELPLYRMRFFYPDQGKLTLLYGNDALASPRYDLELLAPRLVGLASQEIRLDAQDAGTAVAGSGEGVLQKRIFWAAMTGAIIVILVLLARLLRSEPVRP